MTTQKSVVNIWIKPEVIRRKRIVQPNINIENKLMGIFYLIPVGNKTNDQMHDLF